MKYNFDLTKANTKEFFDKNGFALFQNVFTPEEIQAARTTLAAIFDKPSAFEGDWDNRVGIHSLRADLFNRYESLRWLFFKPKIQAALHKVLGDNIGFVPESVAHRKGFGAWHKDTTSQERAGHTFHYEPDWMMVECAIYLQDNDETCGGGLDVIPGTHFEVSDEYTKAKGLQEKVTNKILRTLFNTNTDSLRKGFHIPSKAGDFLFFNKRLIHKASPNNLTEELSKEKEKLAIFFVGGNNNEHLHSYTDFIKSRKDYVYMQNYKYQDSFLAACEAQNIKVVS